MIVLIALGIGMGVPPVVMSLAALTVAAPLPTAAAVLLAGARQARRSPQSRSGREALALVGIAGDLRAGASLRRAITDAAARTSGLEAAGRLAAAGRSIEEVAAAVESGFRGHGRIVAAAVRIAGRMGGETAPVFEELAAQVIDADEMRRERRVAMAPALAQAAVVGGVPILMLGWMATSGRLIDLVASGPPSAVLVVVGVGFTAIGAATVGVLAWRAAL